MTKIHLVLTALFLLLVSGQARAQAFTAYPSLLYPLSINSQALGEQGVTLRDPADAMQYNPAALVYSPNLSATFFANPFRLLAVGQEQAPSMTSYVISTKLPGIGSVGLQYTNWDLGLLDATSSGQNPLFFTWRVGAYHQYERTFSAGFAREMSSEISLGLQLRYVSADYGPLGKANNLLAGAGLLYEPKVLERRVEIGFALTNFGSSVSFDSLANPEAAPSEVNIGIRALPVTNNYFDVDLLLGTSKILQKHSALTPLSAESSFQALFNDWGNFPNDMTAQAGLEFAWHPIPLGGGVFLIQKMYLGYCTTGPKEYYNSFYTNGVDVGIQAFGITATAGYAGRWQNNVGGYQLYEFPWETFQFTLAANANPFGDHMATALSVSPFEKIVLSGGISFSSFLGRMKGGNPLAYPGGPSSIYNTWSPAAAYSVDAAFYFNDRTALTTSFGYTELGGQTTASAYGPNGFRYFGVSSNTQMFYLTSGLRYHPVIAFKPFFVEGDIGITRLLALGRWFQVNNGYQTYTYQAITDLLAGAALEVPTTDMIVTPEIGLRTLYGGVGSSGSRLGGFNQILYSINFGYRM